MVGTIVNTAAVIAGGTIGWLVNRNLPERIITIYFQAIGLFTLAIGITMVTKMDHILIIVSSLAVGSLIGEWINIEFVTEKLADKLKKKFNVGNDKFSEGLITSFLLFCVGSMTILGTIQEGTEGDHNLLYTKSVMDFFSAIILAAALGTGVIFSAIPLFLFQASLTLAAVYLSTYLNPVIVQGLSSVGGILLIGLGVNILDFKKLRIMNMLPALVLVVILLFFLAK